LDVETALLLPWLEPDAPLIAAVKAWIFSLPSTAFCHSSRSDSKTDSATAVGSLLRNASMTLDCNNSRFCSNALTFSAWMHRTMTLMWAFGMPRPRGRLRRGFGVGNPLLATANRFESAVGAETPSLRISIRASWRRKAVRMSFHKSCTSRSLSSSTSYWMVSFMEVYLLRQLIAKSWAPERRSFSHTIWLASAISRGPQTANRTTPKREK